MINNSPIGIFDSGLGGLTVLQEIRSFLPEENIIYLGDTARVPYGTKSKETVVRYSLNNLRFLVDNGAKIIVVACNTASAYALDEIRAEVDIPVIGVVEGGVRAALSCEGAKGAIGIIGTEATINSGAYEKGIKELKKNKKVILQSCPLFVSLVEEGWTDNDVAKAVANRYLASMRGKVDSLVLGCTHYPLLKKVIGEALGGEVTLIDSAYETAKTLTALIRERGMEIKKQTGATGDIRLAVTDSPERSLRIANDLLKGSVDIKGVELVDIL